jgi:hypothetical protein
MCPVELTPSESHGDAVIWRVPCGQARVKESAW